MLYLKCPLCKSNSSRYGFYVRGQFCLCGWRRTGEEEMSHTPGPWFIGPEHEEEDHDHIYAKGTRSDGSEYNDPICLVEKGEHPDDSRLISVAPEMYECLDAIVYWYKNDGRVDESWYEEAAELIRYVEFGSRKEQPDIIEEEEND